MRKVSIFDSSSLWGSLKMHDTDDCVLWWKFTDDATRVPLGDEGGYINASFIKIPVGREEFVYIACQGPLPTTVGDFWQMIWEQNSSVIAMMTQEVEGEKIKCQRYWPNVLGKSTMVSNRLRLALVRVQQLKGFVVRAMTLEDIQVRAFSLSMITSVSFFWIKANDLSPISVELIPPIIFNLTETLLWSSSWILPVSSSILFSD